jgi:cytochrome c oxidase cbb3-type subunit 3
MNALRRAGAVMLAAGVGACGKATTPAIPPTVLSEANVLAGGAAPSAGSLKNPFGSDSASAGAGGQVFSAMNCDGCHGGGATGFVGPSLVDGRWRYGGSDGEIYLSIYYGRPRGMPAYGGILSSDAIWKIESYLRSQPLPTDVPTERWGDARSDSAFAALQQRGQMVMGVDQYTSFHTFDLLPNGGRIVLVRAEIDTTGVRKIREHLADIVRAFAAGDFGHTMAVHQHELPGAAVMRQRRAAIRYSLDTLPGGGAVMISTSDSVAVRAIHEFLGAQRMEHHSGGMK